MFSMCFMPSESDARRRAILRDYLQVHLRGDRGRLIQKSGLSKGRITQLLDEEEPFGERAAQALARRLRLHAQFFEGQPAAPVAGHLSVGEPAAPGHDLLLKWRLLIPEQREEIMAKIDVLVRQNRLAHDQIEAMGLDRFVPDDEVARHLPLPPAQKELLVPAHPPPEPKRKRS